MNKVFFGDCRESLRQMAADGTKVQMCVTSPPYFGLRDYGHEGQLGLEETPEQYIAAMVEVFRCVRDVLADDGVLWVNIGDSYASPIKGSGGSASKSGLMRDGRSEDGRASKDAAVARQQYPARRFNMGDLKQKDMIGIPWMLAFALRADGWYLRQDIIWHKPNPMPESVTDRCTKSHEYIFLLSKSAKYFYDHEAIKERAVSDHAPGNNSHKGVTAYQSEVGEHHRTKAGLVAFAQKERSKRDSFKRGDSKRAEVIPGQTVGTHRPDRDESEWDTATRNKRSVWTVATKPYSGAHFATYPPELIEPCILAGSRPGDIVLDPFFGSGTTGEVAQNLGRRYIGCELNRDYEALQIERTRQPSLLLGAA